MVSMAVFLALSLVASAAMGIGADAQQARAGQAGDSGLTRLTHTDGAMNGNANVAPDGRIGFVSNRTGAWQVWVMNADGSDQRQLTFDHGTLGYASWTPDGLGILFHRQVDEHWQLFRVDVATGKVSRLGFPADGSRTVHRLRPSMSRDGKSLLFDRRADGIDERLLQVVMSGADGTSEAVLVEADAYNSDARYSPDGESIVWQAGTGESLWTLHYQLFTMRIDGSGRRQITRERESSKYPQWSPDGRRIAFSVESREKSSERDVWVMDADGSGRTPVAARPGLDFDAAWTPDGKALVFTTDRFGGRELVRVALP
jgi:Tol biopolymer transport system component